jgi:hypothetical protein
MIFSYFRLIIAAALMGLQCFADGLLINPGFETGDFTGWSTFGTGWRLGIGVDAHSGVYGAVNEIREHDVSEFRGIYQNLPVVGGNAYQAGVHLRTESMNHSEAWLEIQWLDKSGRVISQLQSPRSTISHGFKRLHLKNMVAPNNAVAVSVRGIVMMRSTADAPDYSIFDDFYFVEESEGVSR